MVKHNSSEDKVTVLEGRVKVSSLKHNQFVHLHSEQQVINSDLGLEEKAHVDIKDETGWLSNRLVSKDQPLADLISELERYLPGAVFIKDKQLKQYKINARLDISNPEKALEALRLTLPITITRLTPWVTIISKK